ncbi:sporulation protein [Shewanella sp. 1CM18E]|uniref:sporulation protein n=1 Tax=Shewanella sp. 1CM18E TaxID=2929169 RepID=UPI0020BFEAE9|nr:sporulation protein [Shewanella sp. 1CM18E]MCK8044884.1 sporulation protein [Shewanella sp. 1CM18E]
MRYRLSYALLLSLLVSYAGSASAQPAFIAFISSQHALPVAIQSEQNVQLASLNNADVARTLARLKQSYSLSLQELQSQAAVLASTTDVTSVNAELSGEQLGIPEGEELLLSLYVDNHYLSDVFAIKSKQNAQFSLIGLFELIDFPIEGDFDNRIVKGWYLDETRQFLMRLPEAGEEVVNVSVNQQDFELEPSHYTLMADDIYIAGDEIEKWFGITFDYSFSDLKVEISSSSPLPVQQRLARKKRQLNQAVSRNREAVLPWKESNYQAISSPLVDVQVNAAVTEHNNYQSYSIIGGHDFAFLSSEFYASGNSNDALTDLRLTLSKESAAGDLLGPLKATEFRLGDITPVSVGVDGTLGQSRGVSVTNDKTGVSANNRTINLSGDIQPGWDIELYQNGLLIRQALSLQNGRYEFNDIELLYGDNQFEMIAYGPQGQVKTETKQVYVDSNKLKANESSYSVSLAEIGKGLSGISSTPDDNETGWVLSSTYERGLTDWASINLGVQEQLSDQGTSVDTYAIGGNFNLFERFLVDADYQMKDHQDSTFAVSGRTQIGNQSLSLRYQVSEKTLENLSQQQHTEYNFDHSGYIFQGSPYRLNYRNHWRQTQTSNGAKHDEFGNLLAISTGWANINNQLTWYTGHSSNDAALDDSLTGQLQLQKSFGWAFSRVKLDYFIQPEAEISRFSTEFSIPINTHLQSELELDYYPITDLLSSSASLSWQHNAFSLNSTVSYDNTGDWSLGLYGRFSFGYEPQTEQVFMSSRSLSGAGALMVRVFEDDNLNGRFDAGEAVIEGARVKGVQQYRYGTSNQDGVAMLTSMSSQKKTDIVLDQKSLGDPFLIPAIPGVSITPRRGHIQTLDFPVVNAAEVEGTVYVREVDGTESIAPYATVNLVNAAGDIVATTETEFDGYYLFTDLIPGDYQLSIDTNYLERKKLRGESQMAITLQNNGDVMNGADFTFAEIMMTKGYVMNLGKFNSLAMLKTYWQLVKHNYDDAMSQQVFYIEDKKTKRYALNVAFLARKQQAENGCSQITKQGLKCSVEPFEFEFES